MEIRDVNELKLIPTATMPPNLLPIFRQCMASIERRLLPDSVPRVVLVLKGMSKASATSRHLAGRNSPRGEIVSDGDGDTQIVSFEALDVTAWMAAVGFLRAEVNGEAVS